VPSQRRASALLLAALLALPGWARGSDARGAALERYFRGLQAHDGFSGAVVVSEQGSVVYAHAFGLADRERQAAFTLATPVDGASLTKTFTAAAILALVADGRIHLDDPARPLLPELPWDLTLRQLVTHSNGLPDYDWFEPYLGTGEIRTNERHLAILRDRRPAPRLTPGASFEYSNLGFDAAAVVVERVTRGTFEAFLRDRFFRPLGMTDSFIRPARLSAFEGTRTRGYRRRGGAVVLFDAFDLEGFYGGGNLYTSARDLARWNEAWIDQPPLDAATLAVGLTPAVLGEGTSALTLLNLYSSPDRTRFWYHGHHQGFHDTIWRDLPRRRSVVFVSNSAIGGDLQAGLVPAVVAILDGRHPGPAPSWKPLAAADLEAVTGRWSVDGVGEVEIARDGDFLRLRHVTGVRYRLFRTEPAVFYAPGLDAWIGFDRDARGRVAALVWRTVLGSALGRRPLPRRAAARDLGP